MRARITVAVVAILVLALGLAGGGSLLLVRNAARQTAVRTTLSQAEALARASNRSSYLRSLETSVGDFRSVLDLVGQVAGLKNAEVLILDKGKVSSQIPSRLKPANLNFQGLAEGHATSGAAGSTAYAAVPLVTLPTNLGGVLGGATIALVLESTITFSADSAWYFALAAGVALLVAAAGTVVITSRISRHVVAAASAATRIAGGDLDARVGVAGRDYPELLALGTSINTMAEGLARARQLERQFLLSISHDLRTPLTSIRGFSEAIADHAVPDPAEAALVVVAEAARLERLIRDLLDLAYLDAKRFSLRPVELDVGESIKAAAQSLLFEAEAAGLALRVEIPSMRVEASLDADRLAQVVANLVENAIKFATSIVVVSVAAPGAGPTATSSDRASRHGAGADRAGRGDASKAGRATPSTGTARPWPGTPHVELSVYDDGPGIAPEDLPHVFERLFSSTRRPSRSAQGTGLGLAIVAELAEAMGGSVHVRSPTTPSGGTRFDVRLPLLPPETELPDCASTSIPSPGSWSESSEPSGGLA